MSRTDINYSGRSSVNVPPTTPRWVREFGIITLVLIVFVAIMLFAGNSEHGPGRHVTSIEVTADPTVPADGHTPPIQHGG